MWPIMDDKIPQLNNSKKNIIYTRTWKKKDSVFKREAKILIYAFTRQECLWCNSVSFSSLFVVFKIIHLHTDLEGMAKWL